MVRLVYLTNGCVLDPGIRVVTFSEAIFVYPVRYEGTQVGNRYLPTCLSILTMASTRNRNRRCWLSPPSWQHEMGFDISTTWRF